MGAISWSSKKQATEPLSSSEGEYVAATSAACQAIWMRRILEELGYEQGEATAILCDNISAIHMTRNPAIHSRIKHIGIRVHFIRELVADGQIRLTHCSTNEQSADIFTKALSQEKHSYFRTKLGVCKFQLREGVGK